MTITTEVTWQQLHATLNQERDEIEDAKEEIEDHLTSEFGDDYEQKPLPNSLDEMTDGERELYTYRQELQRYEQTLDAIESRKNLLDELEDEFGSDPFVIKMLSGEETIEIEMELRMLASGDDSDPQMVQLHRNKLTVDAATVDAPSGVTRETKTDEDGEEYETPKPSAEPNGLTLALWEQVERYNNAGSVDFRPGGARGPTGAASSAPQATLSERSQSSDPTDANTQPPGSE